MKRKYHPVVEIVKARGEVPCEEMKTLMRQHGIDPRGIGGLNNANRIQYVPENHSWRLGTTEDDVKA